LDFYSIQGVFYEESTAQSKLDSGEEVLVHLGSGIVSVDCNLKIDGKLIHKSI